MGIESGNGGLKDGEKTQTIRIFSSHEAAELAAAKLKAHGIKCLVNSDDCGGMYPNLTASTGVRLLVQAGDAEAAVALLESKLLPEEINQIETEVVASTLPRNGKSKNLALGQILVGVLVGIILCLLYQWSSKQGTKNYNYRTAEGKDYGGITYQDGHAVKSIKDRNLDGLADEWIYYEKDQVVRVNQDENFDGKPDVFIIYSNDLPVTAEADTDFNGIPDTFGSYDYGIIKQLDFRANGSKITTTREFFHNGVLTEIWRGGDSNGNFSEVVRYDPFFNPISTNVPKVF